VTNPAASHDNGIRIAVDVGGTFTDVVAHDLRTGTIAFDKVPTTPHAPTVGVLEALAKAGKEPGRVSYFAHGSTLGVNALLTRSGARTAIVTTRGFRDVYLLGRTDRSVAYDFRYRKPPSLVPRELIYEVPERLNFHGEVLQEFDRDAARRVAEQIRADRVESVAICLLHAYANPVHELAMEEVIGEVAPDIQVTSSHRLVREYREYERTSTTVLDAYIRPVVREYISALETSLAGQGFGGQFFLIRSDGGAMTARRAKDSPVNLVLSGPAGGMLGAAEFARLTGRRDLITLDMGGTSTDASLVVDGQPLVYHEAEFQGLPIMLSSLHISTIGAGGGSILWIEEGGHLQVGPRSAGAEPGPAAYGRGGAEPTITDAALVCGLLGTETALGGTLRLDRLAAEGALRALGERLEMATEDVAAGAVRIAVTKTVGAIRSITVELGYRPGDFSLLAFGGAGGMVAMDVARELDIGKVVIPPGPGSFSALGMLMADVEHQVSRTYVAQLAGAEEDQLEAEFQRLEQTASAELEQEGFPAELRHLQRMADLRYTGQEHSVSVSVGATINETELARLGEAFSEAHQQRYGHALSDPVELVTIRCRAVGLVERPSLPETPNGRGGEPAAAGKRKVRRWEGGVDTYSVYRREDLGRGQRIVGPAVVEEITGTTVLHEGDVGSVGSVGQLEITIGGDN
jgi:N-methylhydantoinase A